ncbi:peptidase MA family metallohydrolase [Geobacter sp. AOG1]|uniref:peptidase MA family metallohydrolase n=1 Tax=Geobacter sp. AOG1 TaxID=1566346 RepID=UPI001CC81BF7|nr:tetratricopeptide repeat protein [Geobacter sp. AOG1]GFE58943.1 lipoprotein [Geobacter sp. AOG1]
MASLFLKRFFFPSLAFLTFIATALPVFANDPILHNDYALTLLEQGEYEKGLDQLQKAFSLNPYDQNLRKNLAEAYTCVGMRQMERKLYDAAAEYFDHARELLPESPRYAILRGIALHAAKRYEGAIYELERARSLGGASPELYYHLGRAYYDSDNLTLALEMWEKALELDPSRAAIRELADKTRRELALETRMDKGYSSRFSLSYDTELKSVLAGDILDVLETAYNRVGSDLGYFPEARVQVLLYTKKDFKALTDSPDWSGGLYDGKIRIPLGGATGMTPLLRNVLVHEYTHVVVFEMTKGNCPTWLNEGVAELEGRKEFNQPMAELGRVARHGGFLSFPLLERPFSTLSDKQVALAYQQSYALVNFMVARYGWQKIQEILRLLGNGKSVSDAIGVALADYGVDYSGVVTEWQGNMNKEYGVRDRPSPE